MMASLYQSSSTISSARCFRFDVDDGDKTFMATPSGQAAEQQRGIALGIDTQSDAAPFDAMDVRR